MIYYIDRTPVTLSIKGDAVVTTTKVAAPEANWRNLLNSEGYGVFPFIDTACFTTLIAGLTEMVRQATEEALNQATPDFSLERYHHYCDEQEMHLSVVKALRLKSAVSYLPIDFKIIDAHVSSLCNEDVTCWHPDYPASGFFFVRLIRPQPYMDNNPPHRDAWLDHLRDGINAYVPLAGSNELSSLPVVPGSQDWPEDCLPHTQSGATVNGVSYTVPSVMPGESPIFMTRPTVPAGQFMLFSPWILHGGAVNFNPDITRVSLEMRFWKR